MEFKIVLPFSKPVFSDPLPLTCAVDVLGGGGVFGVPPPPPPQQKVEEWCYGKRQSVLINLSLSSGNHCVHTPFSKFWLEIFIGTKLI